MIFSNNHAGKINERLDAIVLLPLGATEQHGPHLGVSTDTDIVEVVARRVEGLLPSELWLLPALPFGSSNHHLHFGGTVSISPQLYTGVIVDLVSSLLHTGFRKIVLLNGHGGNITPVKQALAVLSEKYDRDIQPQIALVTYWEIAGSAFAGERPMDSPALSHACEYETSMMLHLFPERVWMNNVQRAIRPPSNNYIAYEDEIPYRGVTMVHRTELVSGNGSSGEPHLANAAKGKHLVEHAVSSLAAFLQSFRHWVPLMPLHG